MECRPSQYDPGHEIPERSWAYRLLKRFAFNDFGAYEGGLNYVVPAEVQQQRAARDAASIKLPVIEVR